jgi:hypothetical protein
MKYLKKFNESLSKTSFKEKYAKEIASGDIEVKIVDSWLDVKIRQIVIEQSVLNGRFFIKNLIF